MRRRQRWPVGAVAVPAGTHVTTDHGAIRRWAERRGALPATVAGSEDGDYLGVLRMYLPGYGGAVLRTVSWDDWFAAFDARQLSFRYQLRRGDGTDSNYNRLEQRSLALRER